MEGAVLNPFKERKILKKGIPGQATIQALATPAPGANDQPLLMTLHVFVEGMAPYEVDDQWVARKPVTLGWGMVIPVKVSPDDPQQVAVDWKALAAQQAAEGEQRREQLAAMGPVGPEGIAAPTGTQTIDLRDDPEKRQEVLDALAVKGIEVPDRDNRGASDDVLTQLERLAALRDSGALTESEFRAQKRRLLGER